MIVNTKLSIKLDRIIGAPLCWVLYFVTLTVGTLIKRNHDGPYDPKKILIVKLMGVGSIVQALPLIEGIGKKYPNAEIKMLCFPETEIFTTRLNRISAVYRVDNRGIFNLAWSTLKYISDMLKWKPDLALDLEYHSKFSSLLTTLCAANNRCGLFNVTTQFRARLHTHLIYANPYNHISDLYNHMGRVYGVTEFPDLVDCSTSINSSDTEIEELKSTLSELGINIEDNIIAINPNAGDLCLERRWPKEKFAELGNIVAAAGHVVFVGSPGESEYVQSVIELAKSKNPQTIFYNLAGQISFGAFLELLKHTNLFITNDSGPMHLAAVQDAHVISLWGPGIPSHYEPRTKKHVSVWGHVFCSPCLYITREPPCAGNNICMQSISMTDVCKAIDNLVPNIGSKLLVNDESIDTSYKKLPGLVNR